MAVEDEDIALFNNSILSIPHNNIHKISEDNSKIFCFPEFFSGRVEVELDGLINQNNSRFIINLFDESNTKIIPYKIIGSILHITNKNFLLLPKNVYDIFDLLGFPLLYEFFDDENEAIKKFIG